MSKDRNDPVTINS
jgi:hypothetical protein